MNKNLLQLAALVLALLGRASGAPVVIFTNDTVIGAGDAAFDFKDIVVTNCTVMVDGSHNFNRLQILNGGVLTHSFSTNGLLPATFSTSGEAHVISSTNPATLNAPNVDTNSIVVTDNSGAIRYTNGNDYFVTTLSNQFTQLSLTTNSAIADGATIRVSYQWTQILSAGFSLVVSNDMQIAVGGAVNVTGKGRAGGNGIAGGAGASKSTNYPYPFTAGAGGGHGGFGGMSSTLASGGASYDSYNSPISVGSGGGVGSGAGAAGGGAVLLTVGGTLQVDGQILADGLDATNAHAGGGAGGSVSLWAQTISGAGTIAADGGAGEPADGGGGGGGVIALYFDTNDFTGQITAYGGSGYVVGGAGTIYLQTRTNTPGTGGSLLVNNGGKRGGSTVLDPIGTNDLVVTGGAIVQPMFDKLDLTSLFIGSNSSLTASAQTNLQFTVTGNATIESNAAINLNSRGYPADMGLERGLTTTMNGVTTGSGGGYGGYGGDGLYSFYNTYGAMFYGSILAPTNFGSGGGVNAKLPQGSAGGGAVQVTVGGTLSLSGAITANGGDATEFAAGGGAGGSVYLTVGTLVGAGSISANGGAGGEDLGGGGGGGRIAIYFNTNNFTGSLTAYGGAGYVAGGAGTIYLAQNWNNAFPRPVGLVILDNGGLSGTNTPFSRFEGPSINLTVTGGAMASINSYGSIPPIANLFIGSNSWITAESGRLGTYDPSLSITASNATIQYGGGITTDGESLGSQGAGGSGLTSGGGGHGGYGGNSASNAPGGMTYDSITFPSNPGSYGGYVSEYHGGAGGGVIHLDVSGVLRLDGTISADGANGSLPPDISDYGYGIGGGSGGAIQLRVGAISGSGIISANGGVGKGLGGGGGGGRIAVYYSKNLFAGHITAAGGNGANAGGAGTVLLAHTFGFPWQQLIVDNGGAASAATPISQYPQEMLDLVVSGGATVSNGDGSLMFGNLLIGSNSTFLATPQQTLTVLTNATIQSGGRITLDGLSAGGSGNGQHNYGTGGGGGHGGYGGSGVGSTFYGVPAQGGNTYDSITSPTAPGSSGGRGLSYSTNNSGGLGGGSLHMTVKGTLRVDGEISADGVTGPGGNSGGGSGGSVYLTVGTLLGHGTISANGGPANNQGGGGGGGRIAVYFNTNDFTGSLMARGGAGYVAGGAGTIYLTPTNSQSRISKLVVDNGGLSGTNTPVFDLIGTMDMTAGSGASVTLSPNIGGSGLTQLNSLLIASNAALVGFNYGTLSISSNATIQPGGAIDLDGQGFSANHGPGAGTNFWNGTAWVGGGGGHGGDGSMGNSRYALGGSNYDSITEPSQMGSGGGASPSTDGSVGGGALHLVVNGTLDVEGRISANGMDGTLLGAGGGAGGSLWLSAGTFSGSGTIYANGGAGDKFGGGGGGAGGRIAIYFNTNRFTGTLSAKGGAGFDLAGGAGTIYLKTNFVNVGQLLVDNGGAPGSATPITPAPIYYAIFVLNVADGAVATASSPLTLQSLDLAPGGTFRANSTQALNLTVLGDALVDTNAALRADAAGYGLTSGSGTGRLDNMGDGGGGGYGGPGGASLFGAPGGVTYGSPGEPVDFGSPGGMSPVLAGFSQGGGAIRLQVAGALTLNGAISANGNDGVIEGAGGGAGGSIWITAQKFSGRGSIDADGGAGEVWQGGGGGGGRIAVYAATNFFAGAISALGGTGAWPGQYGSLVMAANLVISGSIVDTNGAPVAGAAVQAGGTNAAVSDAQGFYSVTVPLFWNGALAPSNGGSIFVPSLRTYSALAGDATNQNFVAASPGAFDLAGGQLQGSNLSFNWYGITGVVYQPLYSTNLVDWLPWGPPLTGSNAPLEVTLPVTGAPQLFFQLSASY
ncbi:MAG: carboxypeptidase regulatory-like domain-containing protein [Verrucomicrobiota bacterium]|nr:carboxypeptidase regulatory-like domain-containing protein [Verrucomicrobiota bacterium]